MLVYIALCSSLKMLWNSFISSEVLLNSNLRSLMISIPINNRSDKDKSVPDEMTRILSM